MKNPQDNTIKYFIYARKSSEDKGKQVASIEDQLEVLNKIAKQNNIKIVDTYDESLSAKKPGRVRFNTMLERIIKGDANGILCWKLDRLARNPIDGGQINWLLQQGIIQIIKTNERDYYPSDNVLMMQVELGMANQYIRDLSSNVKRGLAKKLRDGWLPGLAPIGYLNDRTNEKGNRTVMNDPERFVLVRRIWDQALTGNYTVPQLWEYARRELKLTTVQRRKSGGRPISKSAMYSLLTNPFYYGMIRYPEKTGELHHGKHEPMITVQEFDRVQGIIGTRTSIRPKNESFAFTGLMKCGNCGCSITAESKQKKCKNGNVHYYTYYHCTKKKVDTKCDQKNVEVKSLEIMFKERLEDLKISDSFRDWAIKYLHEVRTTDADSNKIAMKTASKELLSISEEIRALTLNFMSPRNLDRSLMGEQEYLQEKNLLLKKKETTEGRVKTTTDELESWVELSEKTFNLAYYATIWFENGTDEERKAIMSSLGSNLTLKDGKFQLYLHPFFENFIEHKKYVTVEIPKVRTSENAMFTRQNPALSEVSSKWLRMLNEIRTFFRENPDAEF
jgi:DNA invertase Pin-like site-specific DNA recombinase